MSAMKELIERLEKAEAGSRELDFAIGRALRGLSGDYETWWTFHGTIRFKDGSEECADDFPYYTTNLQDALTLVPEGWSWKAFGDNIEGSMEYGASVNYEPVVSATPALALCIACLRARTEGRAG